MKWIGRGVLSIGDRLLKHGDNIPRNFPKERLEYFKKKGLIGTIIEPVKPEPEKANTKNASKSSSKSGG